MKKNTISVEERHTIDFNREIAETQSRKKTSLSVALPAEPAKTATTYCLSGTKCRAYGSAPGPSKTNSRIVLQILYQKI
jgi:hypothetical protein